ncbi:J domain-containing protein [Microbacterium elymi]|uniref:J domain-containing protein n=1 Tax=Microbacterium elymi TaxID=2909587 RepID=A0ABY5NMM2_9MICO|nr:J domain-containing protein [Microbacterium elymi]UUT36439.1 J domain-containing protein [Microbacterium elymi]
MTLDEARRHLGIERGASVEDIQQAFRRCARWLHPDRFPEVDDAARARLARDFDRARQARDILVRFTLDAEREPAPASDPSTVRTAPRPRPGSRPASTARSRTGEPHPPRADAPRVTLRFDEFVAWTDAVAFAGAEHSRGWIDWPRIIVWSALGLVVTGVVSSLIVAGAMT